MDMAECSFPNKGAPLWHKPKSIKSPLKCYPAKKSSKKSYRARFSDSSRLYTYERPPISLMRSQSYTKDDHDKFGKLALLEGLRIKELIADTPHDSASESIKYLLRRGEIDKHELIGIDHFILGKPTRVRKIRKQHAAAVLQKQQELRQDRREYEDLLSSLSEFAQLSSFKSTQNARVRAAMAA